MRGGRGEGGEEVACVCVCSARCSERNKSGLPVRWCGCWITAERRNEEKAWTTVVGVVLGTMRWWCVCGVSFRCSYAEKQCCMHIQNAPPSRRPRVTGSVLGQTGLCLCLSLSSHTALSSLLSLLVSLSFSLCLLLLSLSVLNDCGNKHSYS